MFNKFIYRLFDLDVGYIIKYKKIIKNYIYSDDSVHALRES